MASKRKTAKAPAKAPTKKATAQRRRTAPKTTAEAVLRQTAKKAEANARKGAKANYTDKGAEVLAKAWAKATTLPTATSAGLVKANGELCRSRKAVQARLAWAKAIGAPVVRAEAIVHANKNGEIIGGRADRTVGSRLITMAQDRGLPANAMVAMLLPNGSVTVFRR